MHRPVTWYDGPQALITEAPYRVMRDGEEIAERVSGKAAREMLSTASDPHRWVFLRLVP